jgi:ribonuclease HI
MKKAIHSLDESVNWSLYEGKGIELKGLDLQVVPDSLDYLAYCDGACSGNPGPGGWGVVLLKRGMDGAYLLHGGDRATTNNKMELTAAIETLRLTERGARCLLRTDSQYVIKGCSEWRKGWERNGMRNSKKEPVANAELWETLWAEIDCRRVLYQWVRGHNGDTGNEAADKLAVLGTKSAR